MKGLNSDSPEHGAAARFPGWLSRVLRVLLGLMVAAFFARLVFGHLQWEKTWQTLQGARAGLLSLAVLLVTMDYFLRGVRWWLMVRRLAPSASVADCCGPFLGSVAINNLVGFQSGDVVRTFAFCERLQLPPSRLAGTLLVEHLVGVVTVFAMFFGVVHWFQPGTLPGILRDHSSWLAILSLVFLLLLMVLPGYLKGLADRVTSRLERAGWRWAARMTQTLEDILDALAAINSVGLLFTLSLLSLSLWILEGAVFLIVARALSMGDVGIGPWLSLAAGTLGMIIPGAPSGLGTFDYFAMMGMAAAGVPREDAAIFALLGHFILWLPPTCLGLCWWAGYWVKKKRQPGVEAPPIK
jgi:glycosyltransferase 2 family protein